MDDAQGKILGVRLDRELLEALEAAAKASRVNVSGYVRMVLAEHLREKGYLQ